MVVSVKTIGHKKDFLGTYFAEFLRNFSTIKEISSDEFIKNVFSQGHVIQGPFRLRKRSKYCEIKLSPQRPPARVINICPVNVVIIDQICIPGKVSVLVFILLLLTLIGLKWPLNYVFSKSWGHRLYFHILIDNFQEK